MAIEHKLERIDFDDDPKRCQASNMNTQCPFKRWEPSKYCGRHGGAAEQKKENNREIRNYRLACWQARVDEFADNPKVKSLREEIGILRMCLENVISTCHDPQDIFMMSHKISDMIVKIEKLVSSCHRLEQSTGQLLDKNIALSFASQIVVIISNHVKDPQAIDIITDEIFKSLTVLTPDASNPGANGSTNHKWDAATIDNDPIKVG